MSVGVRCVECLIGKQKKPILLKVTEPSSIPYRTPSACAKRAAYPDPPPVILLPESSVAQAAYAETLLPGSAQARNVSRYWGSPRATGSHVVNRGTPVAPCRLKAQRKRVTRVGSPCSPGFPNKQLMRSPITGHGFCKTVTRKSFFRPGTRK